MIAWLVILVVLAAAFGPILWFMPSRRERRLTLLRESARKQGLIVEMRRVRLASPEPEDRVSAGGEARDGKRECALYTLVSGADTGPDWRVLRNKSGQAHAQDLAVAGWNWEIRADLSADCLVRMSEVFDALPDDTLAVELVQGRAGCYWLERVEIEQAESVVALLKTHLEQLVQVAVKCD